MANKEIRLRLEMVLLEIGNIAHIAIQEEESTKIRSVLLSIGILLGAAIKYNEGKNFNEF